MAVTTLPVAVLVPAGVLAGLIGSSGGITSLVSYPALLAVGLPPLPANVANIVAATAMGPGSLLTSRTELADTRTLLRRLLPLALVGSVAGALLLLVTPPGVFARVVPVLVAAGALVLLLQPTLTRWHGRPMAVGGVAALVALVGVYAGYFGAGSGVMLLAAVLLHDPRVPRANAVKNVLVLATCATAAVVLLLTEPVAWREILLLASGLLVGGALGPAVVRRVPGAAVRWTSATVGFALAVYLWVEGVTA